MNWDDLLQYMDDYNAFLVALGGLMALLFIPTFYLFLRSLRQSYQKWRRTRAAEMGRKRDMDRFLSDLLVWGLEDAVHKGRFCRAAVQAKYVEIAEKLGLNDLLPKKLGRTKWDQDALKKRIRKRVGPEILAKLSQKKLNVSNLQEMRERLLKQIKAT